MEGRRIGTGIGTRWEAQESRGVKGRTEVVQGVVRRIRCG